MHTSTTNRSIKWIENLAAQEVLIKGGERASVDISHTKDEILEIETATFVRALYYHFQYLIRLFNFRVQQLGLEIKVARASDSIEAFSLSRNGMRLNLCRPQNGTIQLTCDKVLDDDGTKTGNKTSMMFSGLIEAKFGAFHDVEWFFLGSRVTSEQVARHYLTEFIQVSR